VTHQRRHSRRRRRGPCGRRWSATSSRTTANSWRRCWRNSSPLRRSRPADSTAVVAVAAAAAPAAADAAAAAAAATSAAARAGSDPTGTCCSSSRKCTDRPCSCSSRLGSGRPRCRKSRPSPRLCPSAERGKSFHLQLDKMDRMEQSSPSPNEEIAPFFPHTFKLR